MKVGDDMKFVLNKNTPIPLYYQLKQWIIEQIERGDLKSGDVIPSERELSEEFEISRMTVRQALTELVNEGKLIRERGKGTFVAEPKISQDLFRLTSFSEDMVSRGMTPGASVVDVTVSNATPVLQKHFNIEAADKVFIIKRLRIADDKPMALETAHFPLSKFPGLDEQDLNNMSIYRLIETHYKVVISNAHQSIEVGMANDHEAKLLDIRPNSPILRIERVTYDTHRQPIEYVTSVYRGDRYKLFVGLKR